jgi:ABC-type polysaccharide/polyol phosphate export permease
MQHGFLGASPPGIAMLSSNIITTIIIFIVGFFVFQSESRNFDDWI